MNNAELSVAREVLVFDFGMNPNRIGHYSDAAIETMIAGSFYGGVAEFQRIHNEAIEDMTWSA